MRIIFLGPPGAGKGTQSQRLQQRLKVPHISSGEMFRSAIAQETELGRQAKHYLDRGDLVPDALATSMVMERLSHCDCGNGFILDGFPRTRAQVESLSSSLARAGLAIDKVLLLQVPDDDILQRITGRRQDPETGMIYHLRHNPPPPEIMPRLIQRPDDNEAVWRRRLEKYHAEVAAVIPPYEQAGILARIDGLGDPGAVTRRIFEALGMT